MSLELRQQIIDDLNAAVENDEEYAPSKTFSFDFKVKKEYRQTDEVFPRVIVRQAANRPRTMVSAESQAEKESTTTIGYQIEVFTRDEQAKDGTLYENTDAGEIIVNELQQWFWNKLGLARNTWSMSSTLDDATSRSVFRVNGVLDRNGYIYAT